MAALVESMFSVRETPWHGLGTIVQEAPTSADALQLAGLDWEVVQKPLFLESGVQVPNFVANVRSSDNSVLGIPTERYQIVQNKEAFDFTEALIGEGLEWDTAGSLRNGRTVWCLARMPETKILDDSFVPYMCFANSHDGTGAVRVCMTPIRVVCNNTLNMALAGAKRMWSVRHTGNIQGKLDEARDTLNFANKYNKRLEEEADRLANEKLSDGEIHKILDELFPIDEENDSNRKKTNAQTAKDQIIACYLAPDIAKFLNTKYGLLNAVSDWCGHATPARQTKNYQENNWGRIMVGHPVFDKAFYMLTARV